MATVQIRNVDDQAYAILRRRAADSGRSLQEYLRKMLEDQAAHEPIEDILTAVRADLVREVPMEAIVEAQREGRGE
ncbi:hypothetical protein DMH02_004180 [Streptomyces sp. WAC 00631]|uniref:FitA-like ribbon-helix-helix domain-containing protein n=1 Tax=unclassified Streptomyces TaxID=2593676 RepID=UPI000F769055|nr:MULTISPECIES: hypothetical protein [unclassified Streptomyces]MCC5032469.1 hypothetical protein [Streptomyces sp. WAC 00631]MCC9740573.1 hypothetical protein [Streptomyces sp. MNU89]